ncbi:aldo/keto reductase [Oscillatoria sp. FACHB-1406]|uniref:aldo/keto reductase n=1 Tax=Oscillatoria sp. FACHB-1406 TaxID=2692846 RepID=UPI0016887C56|nr:aldo/keto reductase [Oscillatoria sp. FACHB-1406]MBD2576397.1 aldo/keto reductase [Oscillatoria sp. FACHB-1406]
MQTTTLGKNGPTVTALGIGTWAWGDQLFWNYGNSYDKNQVREAYLAAINAGITFFDTAEVYGLGESESLIGQFMKEDGRSVDIATKFGPVPWRFSADSVYEAVTASLKRLQLSRVTLYQVHWPFSFFLSQETLMNALADEVEKGRIGAIGVSNYSAQQMREAHQFLAKRGIPLAVNQVQYSLLSRQIERNGVLATARELGVTILAYSPLAQGLLTGKYSPQSGNSPDGARRFSGAFSTKGLENIAPLLQVLQELATKYQKTPAQIALNWLVAQETIPIPGAKNARQAIDNAGALGWALSVEDAAQLSAMSESLI